MGTCKVRREQWERMNSQARVAAIERAFKEKTAACGEVASVIPCPLPIEGGCGVAAGEACKVTEAPAPSPAGQPAITAEDLANAKDWAERVVNAASRGGFIVAMLSLARAVLHLDALAKAERAYRVAIEEYLTLNVNAQAGQDTIATAMSALIAAGGVP